MKTLFLLLILSVAVAAQTPTSFTGPVRLTTTTESANQKTYEWRMSGPDLVGVTLTDAGADGSVFLFMQRSGTNVRRIHQYITNGAGIDIVYDNPNCEPGYCSTDTNPLTELPFIANKIDINTDMDAGVVGVNSRILLLNQKFTIEAPEPTVNLLIGHTSASSVDPGWIAVGNGRGLSAFNSTDTGTVSLVKLNSSNEVVVGTSASGVIIPGVIKTTPVNVSNLPACNSGSAGWYASVSDATAPTYLGVVVGGGSVKAPVFCNGANWVTH
jgi:hypothetical protein